MAPLRSVSLCFQEDGPALNRLDLKDSSSAPRIVAKRRGNRALIRGIHHQQRILAVTFTERTTEYDKSISGQLVHEGGMIVPQRLSASKPGWIPRRPLCLYDNKSSFHAY